MVRVLLPLLATLSFAASAAASPPPLPIVLHRQISVADDVGVDAKAFATNAETLIDALIAEGWFAKTVPTQDPGELIVCGVKPDPEPCFRSELKRRLGGGPVEVLVTFTAVQHNNAELQCIGPGESSRDPAKQTVLVDLANPSREGRNAAAACIISAAAESGW